MFDASLGLLPAQYVCMSEFLLAFDTSTAVTAVGLYSRKGDPLWINMEASDKRHGDELLPRIQRGLEAISAKPADVQGLVVGIGPGSFTGLRIGISTAQGWNLAQRTPVIGLPSHVGVAAPLLGLGSSVVAVIGDAFKGEVALSLWTRDAMGQPCEDLSPRSYSPEAAARVLCEQRVHGNLTLAGDGLRRYERALTQALSQSFELAHPQFDTPSPTALVEQALSQQRRGEPWDPATLAPLYVRDADAALPAQPLKL